MLPELNADNAFIFRIVHRENVLWILQHGLHCRNSNVTDPKFVQIGNTDLISQRHTRALGPPYGGTLSDYVPFYFTPLSPMFYNIKTGYRDIQQHSNEDIAILFSSLHTLKKLGVSFIFTDRHAYLTAAQTFSDLALLNKIDWTILQRRDFKRNADDLEKVERYEAEALVYKHLPISALHGIACYSASIAQTLAQQAWNCGVKITMTPTPRWYF